MDYSSMSDLLTCARKYQLSKLEGLKAPSDGGPPALNYGSLWHMIQETAFRNPGSTPQEIVQIAAGNIRWQDPVKDYRTLEKAQRGYELWLQRYAGVPWTVTEVELKYNVLLVPDLEPHSGRPDGIVLADALDDGNLERWIVDYKTTGKVSMNWETQYRISNQFKMYYASRALTDPEPIAGVCVDIYCATSGNKQKKDIYELEGHRFFRFFIRMDGESGDLDEMYQDYASAVTLKNVYQQAGYFPKNTSACWNCPFTDICETRDPELREALKEAYKNG